NGQDGWRWCKRCQGLIFGMGSTAGPCPAPPAGSQHDFSGSGNYLLACHGNAGHGTDGTYAAIEALVKGHQFQDAARGVTVKVEDIAATGGSAIVTIVKT